MTLLWLLLDICCFLDKTSILFSLFIAACNSFFFFFGLLVSVQLYALHVYSNPECSIFLVFPLCDVDDLNEMNCNNVNSNLEGTYRMRLCFYQYTPTCCLHFRWGYYPSVWRLCLAGITSYPALGRHCFCLSRVVHVFHWLLLFLVVIGKRPCVCYYCLCSLWKYSLAYSFDFRLSTFTDIWNQANPFHLIWLSLLR